MDHSFIVLLIAATPLSHGWNYKQQDEWPAHYCRNAIFQSPIDLNEASSLHFRTTPLQFENWNKDYNATITNNGHSIMVDMPQKAPISVSGGGLPGTYNLVQFHFHWGSEHTINKERKALEAHFVTYNNQYSSIATAADYRGGIAVLTVMYEYCDKDSRQLKPIVDQVDKLVKPKSTSEITINPFSLLVRDRTSFYRYSGSLTTPNCNDVVVWTIFTEMGEVSTAQVEKFSSIKDNDGNQLSKNFRKIQPLNGRNVFLMCAAHTCA